jgi:fatty-acid desaturase
MPSESKPISNFLSAINLLQKFEVGLIHSLFTTKMLNLIFQLVTNITLTLYFGFCSIGLCIFGVRFIFDGCAGTRRRITV